MPCSVLCSVFVRVTLIPSQGSMTRCLLSSGQTAEAVKALQIEAKELKATATDLFSGARGAYGRAYQLTLPMLYLVSLPLPMLNLMGLHNFHNGSFYMVLH